MTYELFLAKALELFGEKGYSATTIDDIASAAGSTRTTFYLHFSSKADVMSALLTKVDAILTAADNPTLTAVVASGSRGEIHAWLDRKFSQWDEIKPYLTASYEASYEPDVEAKTEQWFESAVEDMTAGLDTAKRLPAGPAPDPLRAGFRAARAPLAALLLHRLADPARDLPRRNHRILVLLARSGQLRFTGLIGR